MQRELERLRAEVEALRVSRRRLVLAADADRRTIERELHDGVHQHLIALAVSLQLAGQAADTDPAAVSTLVAELDRDVHEALGETARLAQRIHPPSLAAGDLGALLRSAATDAGVPAAVQVAADSSYAPELVMTIHVCWLHALARSGGDARVTIDVHGHADALTFEIAGIDAPADADVGALRDRVEALGGALTFTSVPGGAARVSGVLPLAR